MGGQERNSYRLGNAKMGRGLCDFECIDKVTTNSFETIVAVNA